MRFFLAILVLLAITKSEAAKTQPQNPFVDHGACPFECCKYQKWNVENDTPIFDKINGSKQVGTLIKGTKVDAITGEVHVEPNPVTIVYDKGYFTRGETIYLLTTQGEGFYKIWHKEKIDSIEALDLFENSGEPKKCINPSKNCWGRPLKSIMDQKRVWWIKFKSSTGKTGWSKESNNFSGNDTCS